MRRHIAVLTVAALAFGFMPSAAAATSLKWSDTAGIELHASAVGPDGSIYVAGEKLVGSVSKALLIKYAADGTELWSKSWSPTAKVFTSGTALDIGADGTVVWVGAVQQPRCEGGGWWLEVRRPNGSLLHRYLAPGWKCHTAERAADVAIGAHRIVVAGYGYGCCDDPAQDGWVQAFTRSAKPRWTRDFEPPADVPSSYVDRATGIALGATGTVFVVGWAATANVFEAEQAYPVPGLMVLQKLSPIGEVLLRKAVHVGRYGFETPAKVAVRGSTVMVLGAARPGSVWWGGSSPGEPWLARLSTAGDVLWSRTWAHDWSVAAIGADLSIDAGLHTWVAGTQRDPSDRGFDVFVRRFGPSGTTVWRHNLDDSRFLWGTGAVAVGRAGAAVTGYEMPSRVGGGVVGHVWVYRTH